MKKLFAEVNCFTNLFTNYYLKYPSEGLHLRAFDVMMRSQSMSFD